MLPHCQHLGRHQGQPTKDIIDLLGRLEQDNPQYTADEMIAKVVTHQKALQTLGTLSISHAVILLKPFSNFAEISEESDQISAHYGSQAQQESSTRVLELQRTGSCRFGDLCSSHMGPDPV
jgi:hypothetical protein